MGIAEDKELTRWAHGAGRERAWYRQGGVEQEQGEGVAESVKINRCRLLKKRKESLMPSPPTQIYKLIHKILKL